MLASIRAFLWRILHLQRRTKSEVALDSELEFHLQMETKQNLCLGMSPEEARRQALISLGGLEQTREECRETRAIRWAAELRQDLIYGWRIIWKSPIFTGHCRLDTRTWHRCQQRYFLSSAYRGSSPATLPRA